MEIASKILEYLISISLIIFGLAAWHKMIFEIYMPGIGHIKKFPLLILTLVWTIGFVFILYVKIRNSKLGSYSLLIFLIPTLLFNKWLTVWGFPLFQTTIIQRWNLIFLISIFFFVSLCWKLSKTQKSITKYFSNKYIRDASLLFLFFSMAFLITQDVYNKRNPATIHNNYFSDRNLFPPDYRVLVPSFIEVSKNAFNYLNLDYFTNTQRLYKIYLILMLTFSPYIYYLFLKEFFKKTAAFMISVLLLLLFYISFQVGGLIDDPLHLLSFITGLILIYYRKDIFFWLLIFIASFNKETIWFLIFVYLIHNLQWINRKNWWKIFGKTSVMSLTFFWVTLLKIVLKPIHETDFNWIIYNFSCEQCILHVFLLLSIFWILAFFFKEYPKQLHFFSRLNFITPFYFAWHYLGLIREVRLFIPIGLILIPLGMSLLFPESVKEEDSKGS